MGALALALASSISWGLADFVGGLKARRLHLLTVVFGSQAAGLVLIATVVAIRGEGPPPAEFVPWAIASGVVGVAGLAAFYRGLSVGAMSVVAPISATAAAIPVTVGLATGDRPTALQGAGMAVALLGVVLAAREEVDRGAGDTRLAAGVGLAVMAAVGFGLFFVTIDVASEHDPLWATCVNRFTTVPILIVAILLARPRLRVGARNTMALALVGVLDVGANVLYASASREGLIALVSVIASLFPVVVVLLARAVLKERLQRSQQAGVLFALVGVALIAGG